MSNLTNEQIKKLVVELEQKLKIAKRNARIFERKVTLLEDENNELRSRIKKASDYIFEMSPVITTDVCNELEKILKAKETDKETNYE